MILLGCPGRDGLDALALAGQAGCAAQGEGPVLLGCDAAPAAQTSERASWTRPAEGCFSPAGATAGCRGCSLSLGAAGLQAGEGTYRMVPHFRCDEKKMDASKTFFSYRVHDNR